MVRISSGTLRILDADITTLSVDVVVNAANSTLLGGGGVDGAIHQAAGPELCSFCKNLGGCTTGKAKITPGFNLPARYIIHTVGPVWGEGSEEKLLTACYRNSLLLATENGCRSIAFPAISTGAYGYPKDRAAGVAVSAISMFLQETDAEIEVILVCRGDSCRILEKAVQQFSGTI